MKENGFISAASQEAEQDVSARAEVLSVQFDSPDVQPEGDAAVQVNPFYRALCKTAAFFGFGNRLYNSSKKRKKFFADLVVYLVLVAGAFLMLYPFWWMLVASVNNNTINMLQTVWWPISVAEDGIFSTYSSAIRAFSEISRNADYWRIVFNTLLYSVVPVVVGVIVSAAAAFAFAKLDFKGRNAVFFYCMFAVMIPFPAIIIVQYCLYATVLNWTTNGLAMIIPGCFGSVMTAFFIRQYLYGLPDSILEAAKIDGAGYWRIFWQFIMPLGMPAVMAQGILSFMGAWNNYLGPQMFIDSYEWYHMTQALDWLDSYVASNPGYNGSVVIAASVLALLPVLVLFGVFQKTIIGSIMLTGSKE